MHGQKDKLKCRLLQNLVKKVFFFFFVTLLQRSSDLGGNYFSLHSWNALNTFLTACKSSPDLKCTSFYSSPEWEESDSVFLRVEQRSCEEECRERV